jgi:DNA-binding transcriptional LysR family regulator
MTAPGSPTLDQLQVLLAVQEAGSFAGAARRLNRATSAITYAIDNLEAQLGLPLFDRVATRKPALTEAGRAVLAEACNVARGIDKLRATVKGLLDGLEAEVSVAVDVMLPTARLVDALRAFQTAFPTVALRLRVEALGAVTQLVLDGTATLGVSGMLTAGTASIERIAIGGARLIPVAAPFHPLAQGPQGPGVARAHIQLVLTDRSRLTEGQDFGVVAVNTWRLGRPWGEARPAAGGRRLGRHAGAGGARRHRGGTVGRAGPAGLACRDLRAGGDPPHRYAAGAGGALADRALRRAGVALAGW